MIKILVPLIISVFFLSEKAQAFPNMVRHGYTTCVTCHYNASGGGSLTSYGKYIAGETMGTFNNSETAMRWLTKPTDYEDRNDVKNKSYVVAFLGRANQAKFSTPQLVRSDIKMMQADLEGAFDYNTWTGLITLGPRLDSAQEPDESKNDFFVRRFYVGKQALNYSIKAGKFFPEYGLNLPNHNVATRKGLFFNHNQETTTYQASYFTQTFDITAARLQGTRATLFEDMTGYSGTLAYKRGSNRVGISQIRMSNNDRKSQATSLFGQFGYGGHGYTLAEVAQKKLVNARGRETQTNVGYFENGWEFYRGIIPNLNWEFTDNTTTDSVSHAPGLGLQFLPWTHVELTTQYSRTYTPVGNGYLVYTMLNIYF